VSDAYDLFATWLQLLRLVTGEAILKLKLLVNCVRNKNNYQEKELYEM